MEVKIRKTPLSRLKANPRNPRSITEERFEHLKKTLEAMPSMLEARPLIALPDGTVIAGNMRLRAALELGWKSIPVATVDLDRDERQLWLFLDNEAFGEYDDDLRSELIYELHQRGIDLDLTGLPKGDVRVILSGFADDPQGALDPDADVPLLPKKPKSKRGEVYELGRHRLFCGDATDPDQVRGFLEPILKTKRAPLLFTSPPYLDAREYGGSSDLELATLTRFLPVFRDHAELLAVNLGIIRREHEILTYWNGYLDAARAAGLKLLSWNVWDRGQPWSVAQNTAMFPLEHEWVFVWGERAKKLNLTVPNKEPGARTGITNRQPDGTLSEAKTKVVREKRALGTLLRSPPHVGPDIGHPAIFPVALPEGYLEAATKEGDFVIDCFGGAGTTLIAAERLDRTALLIEIEPAYCDVTRERFKRWIDG